MFSLASATNQSKQRVRSQRAAKRVRPWVEWLETRLAPAWLPIGPAAQTGWIVPNDSFAEAVSGRVSALAYAANFDGMNSALFLGTAGGGVWKTTQPDAAQPDWQPVSDAPRQMDGNPLTSPYFRAGTAAIGALAVDPNNPRVVYAGTGEANYVGDSRYGAGVMRSLDVGANWNLATGTGANATAFYRHSISKIVIDPTVTMGAAATLRSRYVYAAVVPPGQGHDQGNAASRAEDGIYESRDGGDTWNQIWSGGAHAPAIVTDMDFTISGG